MGSASKASGAIVLFFLFCASSRTVLAIDCNQNRIEDPIDIRDGSSRDCNGNAIPDECDLKPSILGFQLAPQIPISAPPTFVTAADLDGDGDAELITANGRKDQSVGDSLSVIENLGNTLGPITVLGVGIGPTGVVAADLDGDGDLDLASANEVSKSVSVLFNLGNLSFSPAANHPVDRRPLSLRAGDFDRDGRVDLVMTNDREIFILLNQGKGTFRPGARIELRFRSWSLILGDLDLDGDLDLATANGNGNAVSIFLNSGDGTFSPGETVTFQTFPASIAAADLDLDGHLDLIRVRSGTLSVLRNRGNGTFEAPQDFPFNGNPAALAVGDLDGDGLIDLAIGRNDPSHRVTLFFNRGDGAVWFEDSVQLHPTTSILAADVDGDAYLDLVATLDWPTTAGVSVISNLGGGQSWQVTYTPIRISDNWAISLAAADLDGDGSIDLATADYSGTVSVILNRGNGTFTPARNFLRTRLGYSPFMGAFDFDGDGDTDLATGYVVLLNQGKGTFNGTVPLVPLLTLSLAAVADLDGDGFLDLILAPGRFATNPSSTVSVVWNLGNGTFSDPVSFETGGPPYVVVAADLDGDRRLDLATGNYQSDNVSVLLQRADGTFGAPWDFPVGAPIASIAAADLDGDGFTDLCVGIEPGGSRVLINQGNGTFRRLATYYSPGGRVITGDLDRDGDVDLAGSASSSVGVVLNHGDGRFTAPRFFRAGGYPSFPVAADLDADGDLDLAAVSHFGYWGFLGSSTSLAVFLNHTVPPASLDRNRNGAPDECEGLRFHRGDPNGDGALSLSDAVSIFNFLFLAGETPSCRESADVDNDARISLSDGIALLDYLFVSGAPPADPGPPSAPCGPDPDPPGSPGDLGCGSYAPCRG